MSEEPSIKNQDLAVKIDDVKTTAVGFAGGFSCLFKGFRFIYREHQELLKFCIPPMILAIGLIVFGWIFFWVNSDDMVRWIWSEPEKDAWWGVLHFLWSALAVIIWLLLAIANAVLTVILFSVLAAPFSDFISERAEGILGTWEPRPFSLKFLIKDLWQTIRMELTRAAVKLAWLLPLFILSLIIPVVGQIVYVVLGGYFLSKYTGMDYVDWCAARRGWTWKERFAFAKKHRFALAGLGTAVVLSLMIPLAFAIVWPAAVAGGAILFTSLNQQNE